MKNTGKNLKMQMSSSQSSHGRKAARLISLAACSLMLVACESNRKEITGSVPDDYRLRHPITLEQSARTLDIPVGMHSEKLTPSNVSAISEFARQFQHERAAVAQVMVPSGSNNESSAGYVGKQVRTELLRSGLKANQVDLISYSSPSGIDAPIRLAYPRVEAKVPQCGLHPKGLERDMSNRSYFNFGCASQTNLANAVANPQDLIQPRGWDPKDSNLRTKVYEKYRNGEPTWSEDLGSDVGASSEVSK